MSQKHLSDDRLIEICLTGTAPDGDQSHLTACAPCELRRLSVAQLLDEVGSAADADESASRSSRSRARRASSAFSISSETTSTAADRLARQRTRILQRIEQEGRPGRLLSFPASQPQTAMMLRSRPRARWAAGAVAAAFVVGMVAGHLAHDLPAAAGTDAPAAARIVSNERDTLPLRAVSTTWSDEEFLAQIEQAAIRISPAALGPLDAMTPRAWEAAR